MGIVFCLLLLMGKAIYTEAAQEQTIKIGYIDYDGFFIPEENGGMTGYGIEYLREIAKYTNWRYEFVYDSWENHMQSLAKGEIDFICHAQKTKEREEKYLFSKYSIGVESGVLYVGSEDERYYYNDFAAFDGMKIAVLQDSFQNDYFIDYAKEKGFSCTYVGYDTQQACFDALDKQEVDGAVLGSLALKSDYKVACRFGSEPFYFMTGKQNENLLKELDEALSEIKVNAPYFEAELFNAYYGEGVAVTDPALTREEIEFVKNHEPITVAFLPDLQPMSYINENGEIVGITVDIVKKLEEKSGFQFHFQMMDKGIKPIDYLYANREVLLAGVMTDNLDFWNGEVLVSDCFYTDDVVLVGKKGREYTLDEPEVPYRLAIPKNYAALENYISGNYPEFTLVKADSTEDCIRMVLHGEADLMAQNGNAIMPLLTKPKYEKLMVLPASFMQERAGMVLIKSKDNQMVMNILDKCVETISTKEISQFTIDHTITNSYKLTWKDLIYKFRYVILVATILGAIVLVLSSVLFAVRRRNYVRLEIKNRQLADAVTQADNANYAKSRFLATMSHEIRTPLNAIMGLVKIAENHVENPKKTSEYLKKINTSSQMLLNIINEVLDMSAIESNKLKIAEAPFDLKEVLESILVVYQEQCRQKGVELQLDISEVKHEKLLGDEYRLRQVLLNLVSNAFKFTASGGRITVCVREVSLCQEKAYFNFSVADTGEGMSEEMLGRLFKPFEQENAHTAQKHGGSGLGLSITKNLVELMHGTISCNSAKGKGTTFRFSLPFAINKEQDIKIEAETQEHIETENLEYDFGGLKVLLAEDTQLNAEIAKELLQMVNIKVDHAWNGQEALEMFESSKTGQYAAILLDIQMPQMDGYEAARAIRASLHVQAKEIPIFAMSANAFAEDVSLSLNAGMNGHLSKPIDTEALYSTLAKCTNIRGRLF